MASGFDQQIDALYDNFLQYLAQSKVIILHPDSKYRSVLAAKIINDPSYKTLYYALSYDDIDLQNFIMSIAHDLPHQHPTFGRKLHLLPPAVHANTNKYLNVILENFVQEIAEYSDQPFVFILDEFDRADEADDVQRFVTKLADHLPPHCKLVINSRTLPRLPIVAMIASRQATLLRDGELIDKNFYGTGKPSEPKLEMYGLGPGFVLLDNDYVDDWEGHLPRLLLFFVLDKHVVTRSEICASFWPELDIDQAVNVFHVTKRRLHKALDLDVLAHTGRYYHLNPDVPVRYDLFDFVDYLMEGRNPENPNPFEAYEQAAKLYRGPFMLGNNEEWILERRPPFRAGYLEAIETLADIWIKRGRSEIALKLYQDALAADYTRTDIHRKLMKLYADLGRRNEAVIHYQQFCEFSFREGKEPEAQIQKLYHEIVT